MNEKKLPDDGVRLLYVEGEQQPVGIVLDGPLHPDDASLLRGLSENGRRVEEAAKGDEQLARILRGPNR